MIDVVLLTASGVPGGNSPEMSRVIVCVPGVNGCKSATHPSATDRYGMAGGPGSAGAPKMLSAGRSRCSSGEVTSATWTGVPSRTTMTLPVVIPAFTARAHARSSVSLLPKNGGGSSVLHSADHAATKIFVPGLTTQVIDAVPGAPNGAMTPSRSTHKGPPLPNGFSGVGVSSTAFHIAPRSSPSLWLGAAVTEGAVTPRVNTTTVRTRARRDM